MLKCIFCAIFSRVSAITIVALIIGIAPGARAEIVIYAVQTDGNVVFSTPGGSLNLFGLQAVCLHPNCAHSFPPHISPDKGFVVFGPPRGTGPIDGDLYSGVKWPITRPTGGYGTSGPSAADEGSWGPTYGHGNNTDQLIVPPGYESGQPLPAASITIESETFESLGMYSGTFDWFWTGDSITLIVGATSVPEICGNGIDDDLDGLTDSLDPDCVEICDNGIDDDQDGLIDAEDPDCVEPEPQVGLLIRCIHSPLWPQDGELITIRAEAIGADGADVVADRIEIYANGADNIIGGGSTLTGTQAATNASGSRFRYGCKAERSTEAAFSGWREVDVGAPELPDLRAIPVIYNGPFKDKIDIVFLPELSRHPLGATDSGFQDDIYRVIKEGIYEIPWFTRNQQYFNFWLGRDHGVVTPKDASDSSSLCKKDKPDKFKKSYAFADAVGIIHDQACRDNSSPRTFSTTFDELRLQVVAHEIGHAVFSLSDEYNTVKTIHFSIHPFPNVLTSEFECRNHATVRGYDPDDCRLFKSNFWSGFWWIFEPDYRLTDTPDLMQGSGSGACPADPNITSCDQYAVGPSEEDRMNWIISLCENGTC